VTVRLTTTTGITSVIATGGEVEGFGVPEPGTHTQMTTLNAHLNLPFTPADNEEIEYVNGWEK